MSKRFGMNLNGVDTPHRQESHVGRVSTAGADGKSVSVTNMNGSQFRNLVPVMPYGVASSPIPGVQAFVLLSNDSGNDGIIGVYDAGKPACAAGDIVIYSAGGATVRCTGGTVLINGVDVLAKIQELEDKINGLS